jgi:hypothetical protein
LLLLLLLLLPAQVPSKSSFKAKWFGNRCECFIMFATGAVHLLGACMPGWLPLNKNISINFFTTWIHIFWCPLQFGLLIPGGIRGINQ